MGLIWNSWLRGFMYKKINIIGTSLEYLENTAIIIDEIQTILDKISTSHTAIIEIRSRRKMVNLLYSTKICRMYDEFYSMVSIFILKILTDLRFDLIIRVKEQEKNLKKAKSEVTKHIQ
jgi:hypothetical protein